MYPPRDRTDPFRAVLSDASPFQPARLTKPSPSARQPDLRLQNLVQKMIEGGESEDDIAGVIQHYKSRPVSAEEFTEQPEQPEGSAAGRFFGTAPVAAPSGGVSGFGRELWKRANPLETVKGLVHAAGDIPGTVKSLITADPTFLTQAKEAAQKGDYLKAGRKVLSYASMGLGHDLDTQADLLLEGRYAEGAGAMAGTATQMLAPELALRGAAAIPRAKVTSSNPAIAEAVKFGQANKIPVDAAAATDNAAVRAVQHLSDRSLGGSYIAGKAAQRQTEGLATLGEQLAAKSHGRAVTAAEAGSVAQKGVGGVVSEQRGLANDAYGRLRNIEERALASVPEGAAPPVPLPADRVGHFTLPKPKAMMTEAAQHDFLTRHGGTNTAPSMPVMSAPAAPRPPVSMVVDLSPVKAGIRPIAERLAAKKGVTGALIGKEGNAAAHLEALLSGPDAVPLSVADAALSDLKQLARTNHPDLRNVGQGIAAKAVSELHAAVSATAKAAGPDAVAALTEGRLATKAKYEAAAVLKTLEGAQRTKSAVTAFRGLTQTGDTAIGHLRDVIKQAPDTKPFIARAVLDGLIESPTAGAAKTLTDWKKLGMETKAALYTPEHIADLDKFFLLRERIAKNANPSGSAHAVAMLAQGTQLWEPLHFAATIAGTAGLSTFLHSPAGVKLLTSGMKLPPSAAVREAWLAKVKAFAAGQGAIVAAGQPAGASPAK